MARAATLAMRRNLALQGTFGLIPNTGVPAHASKTKYAIVPMAMSPGVRGGGRSGLRQCQARGRGDREIAGDLTEAIRRAEKEGDGQAISAEYEFKGGNPAYFEVKVLRNDGKKLTRYDLDPSSGKIKETSNEAFEKIFTSIKPTSIQNAPTSLTRAISTAEHRSGGKATMAEVSRDGDQLKYTVKTVKLDGTSKKMEINGSDGKVASAD